MLENSHHIYVCENSVWDLKGQYDIMMAVKDDDGLMVKMLRTFLW